MSEPPAADDKLVSEASVAELVSALKKRLDVLILMGIKESNKGGGQVENWVTLWGFPPLVAGCMQCLRGLSAQGLAKWTERLREGTGDPPPT